MKTISVDPNLVALFLVIAFLIFIMVRTLENKYFLARTKLGYLRYMIKAVRPYFFSFNSFVDVILRKLKKIVNEANFLNFLLWLHYPFLIQKKSINKNNNNKKNKNKQINYVKHC